MDAVRRFASLVELPGPLSIKTLAAMCASTDWTDFSHPTLKLFKSSAFPFQLTCSFSSLYSCKNPVLITHTPTFSPYKVFHCSPSELDQLTAGTETRNRIHSSFVELSKLQKKLGEAQLNMADALDRHATDNTRIKWLSNLNTEFSPKKNYRRTSIICTIGSYLTARSPASAFGKPC